jgi:hypothetical protein
MRRRNFPIKAEKPRFSFFSISSILLLKMEPAVWYYDMTLTDAFQTRKVNKGNPLTLEVFHDFFERLALDPDNPDRISERSWYVSIDEIKKKKYDLKGTNDNAPDYSDKRTTSELMAIIQDSQKQIEDGLKQLQK